MRIPKDSIFCVFGVGAIIEHKIKEKKFVLIQNRIRKGDEKQDKLIEVPCGKVKAMENAFDVIQQRVWEETGLIVTSIKGKGENRLGNTIQSSRPFYTCQSIDPDFPVTINFFICTTEGIPKPHTEAANNIRWISIEELSKMLVHEEEKFFPVVVDALKEYVMIEKTRGGFEKA